MESPGKFIEDEELREAMNKPDLARPQHARRSSKSYSAMDTWNGRGHHLVPTSRGTQVVSLAPKILSSPELTAQWELRLDKISHGQENSETFLADIRKNTVQLVESVKVDTSTYREENLTRVKCPMCGKFPGEDARRNVEMPGPIL